jgi:ferrous iron transport protein A
MALNPNLVPPEKWTTMNKTLKDLKPGEAGVVINIMSQGPVKRRLIDMGVTPGAEIVIRKTAPFGDPIEIHIRGYELSLRKDEAKNILVEVNH